MSDTSAPQGEPATTEILLEHLRQAAAAHHIYQTEELGGQYHKNWPQWYAEHMTRTLAQAGYRLVRHEPASG